MATREYLQLFREVFGKPDYPRVAAGLRQRREPRARPLAHPPRAGPRHRPRRKRVQFLVSGRRDVEPLSTAGCRSSPPSRCGRRRPAGSR